MSGELGGRSTAKLQGAEASAPLVSKAEWRERMRARLQTLDAESSRRAAERLAEHVMGLPEVEAGEGVLVCLSFGLEIDTWGLVDRLLASGRRVYVPRAAARTKRLHVHPYPCELAQLSFGLKQPKASCAEVEPEQIDTRVDVALILALAFDRRGYRLGYGAGFFDRFLVRRPFLKVGLAFESQLVDRLPVEAHDIPMDAVISDQSILRELHLPGKRRGCANETPS